MFESEKYLTVTLINAFCKVWIIVKVNAMFLLKNDYLNIKHDIKIETIISLVEIQCMYIS